MLLRILSVFLISLSTITARSQKPSTGADLPSPEVFVNSILSNVIDSSQEHFYLLAGTDTCRFLKYNYEEWTKYHLSEPVTFNILNELSEKVYLARYPYFWKQPRLHKAICITRHQADSIIAGNPPTAHQPNGNNSIVFSFSLPEFTDDGQYAVIDLNFICGPLCGEGSTCIFRLTNKGEWKLIGQYTNWSS